MIYDLTSLFTLLLVWRGWWTPLCQTQWLFSSRSAWPSMTPFWNVLRLWLDVHWFLDFLPSPLVSFAGISPITCCLSLEVTHTSSLFVICHLSSFPSTVGVLHSWPTSSYSLSLSTEISSTSTAIQTNDFPQLSSELEILTSCLWPFLPSCRYFAFSYLTNWNISPLPQCARLLCSQSLSASAPPS